MNEGPPGVGEKKWVPSGDCSLPPSCPTTERRWDALQSLTRLAGAFFDPPRCRRPLGGTASVGLRDGKSCGCWPRGRFLPAGGKKSKGRRCRSGRPPPLMKVGPLAPTSFGVMRTSVGKSLGAPVKSVAPVAPVAPATPVAPVAPPRRPQPAHRAPSLHPPSLGRNGLLASISVARLFDPWRSSTRAAGFRDGHHEMSDWGAVV